MSDALPEPGAPPLSGHAAIGAALKIAASTIADRALHTYSVEVYNERFCFVAQAPTPVIVRDDPHAPIEDRFRLYSIQGFKDAFGNFHDKQGGKVKSHAALWVTDPERRTADGIEFLPSETSTPGYFNLWQGWRYPPEANGLARRFLDHLAENVCDGDAALMKWVLAWFASMVQRPMERPGTALVVRGKRGSGKSIVGEVFGALAPAHYYLVDDPRYVTGNFNQHLGACLLLQADEGFWAGDVRAEGRLKGLITSRHHMIEGKHKDAVRMRNFVRLLVTSNEGWVVPAALDERRFAVIDCHPRRAQDRDYFGRIWADLARGGFRDLMHLMLTLDLDDARAPDPARAPRTTALWRQKMASLDAVQSWYFRALTRGTQTRHLTSWEAFVSSEALYADYLKHCEEIGQRFRKTQPVFIREWQELSGETTFSDRRRFAIEGAADYETSRQYRGYEFQTLDECRADFDRVAGHEVDWAEG